MSVQSANCSISRIWAWPAYLLIFLMLVFPGVLSLLYWKAALFAWLIIGVSLRGVNGLHLHPKVVLWTLLLAVVSLCFGLRGLFLGAPGALNCIQVYFMWPLVYLLLLGGIGNVRILQGIEKTLVFSSSAIALFGVVFSLSKLGILPEISHLGPMSSEELGRAGFYEGHVELFLPGLAPLMFLIPFLLTTLAIRTQPSESGWVARRWVYLGLFLCLPLAILSGTRALQLVALATPLLALGAGAFLHKKDRSFLIKSVARLTGGAMLLCMLALVLLRPVYTISLEGIAERFSAGFDFSYSNLSDSSEGRRRQYFALTQAWMQHPFIGAGLGAPAHEYLRDPEHPWSYEEYYLSLLVQTGMVGFACYAAGVLWTYWSGLRLAQGNAGRERILPLLVGMVGFLIGAGTNPYLARFDGIWVIFLPLAAINYWLCADNQTRMIPLRGIGHQASGFAN
jgi:hypothetical protein